MGAPDKLVITKKPDGVSGHPSIIMDPRAHDRETLRLIISQWNSNRLDLFELSEPDENMEFYGVMRFYFQEEGSKITTKCVRVSSGQMATQVVQILVEKFRPDMRMLTLPRYGLYEVHANGEERRLREEEKPLLVQLNWHKDDREGRFLLKNEEESKRARNREAKKKTSKQEKKEQKRKEKEEKIKDANESLGITAEPNDAENLFKQLPETSFHRSISNPEAVMRRRRQQKLEKKLQQFKSKDGGPDSGGTLKIFGETINRDVPYKTLLLSVHDNVESVIKQTLEKYGLERDDHAQFCLVQAVLPPGSPNDVNVDPSLIKETVLASTDCPLQILMHFPASQGILVFNLKKRPAAGLETVGNDASPDNGISRPLLVQNPYLIESLPNGVGQAVQLFPGITEIGNDHHRLGATNFFHLVSPDIFPSHCFFHRLEASVVVSLASDRPAMVSVDGRKVETTAVLQNGSLIRIGQNHVFRFCVPSGFGMQNGGPAQAQRDKLQLPLVGVAQPKKASPDYLPPGHFKNVPSGNQQLISRALNHLDCLDGDLPDTNSSVTYSHRSSPEMHAIMTHARQNGNGTSKLPILPATLEFREDREDAFLFGVIISPNPVGVNFKLSPAYILYMAARYRGSTNFRPEVVPMERAHLLSKFLRKIASIFHRVVEENQDNAEYLCFWLANSSELLHLLKLDRHMSIYGADAHDILSDCVHLAFHHLVRSAQEQEQTALPGLFADDDNGEESESGGWGTVLEVLTRTLSLARRCRLNAALTIQVFRHLFHYICMWLFNSIVHHPDRCNRHFGTWLRGGLDHLLQWADKHGLEQGAEYHLAKIIQVTNLLNMPKEDTNPSRYASAAYRLNSFQVRFIMEMYERSPDDLPFTAELVDEVTRLAVDSVDELERQAGQAVQLEEPAQLQLNLVIPEEGYSVGIVNGVPPGLREFLDPLTRAGVCEMVIHPYSQGSWTVYLVPTSCERSPSASFEGGRQQNHPTQQHLPTIIEVSFPKGSSGIGLSILAYPTPGQAGKLGVYVKAVVKGGAADQDGRLESGDQLLKVNGKSLVGVTQEHAAKLIAQSGPNVQMEVLKHGAMENGIATMLTSPSPPPPFKSKTNGHNSPNHYPRPLDFSGRDEPVNGGFPGPGRHTVGLLHKGELIRPTHQQQQQMPHHYHQEATTPTRVVSMPPPGLDYRMVQSSPDGRHMPHETADRSQPRSVTQRTPSPSQEALSQQVSSQRDKFRKDAKFFEIEDELRRRREQFQNGHQSPVNGIRPGPAMNGRTMPLNGQRTMSNERLDGRPVNGHGKPPVEKRVQFAEDSPKKSSSPTTSSQHSSSPTGPVRHEQPPSANQPARIAIPPTMRTTRQSPVTVVHRVSPAQDPPPWPRSLAEQVSSSSSNSSHLMQDDYQRLKMWKQSEMRRFRDETIASLEEQENDLMPNEAEKLRILRLERDFAKLAAEKRTHDDEDDDDGQDDEEEEDEKNGRTTNLPVTRPAPHLQHAVALNGPVVYRTNQQEDYGAFIRRQEKHAVDTAIQRNREQLEERVPTVRFHEPQIQHQSYALPEISRHSASPPRKVANDPNRLSVGSEIRKEVESAKSMSSNGGSASVVGVNEIYNDPRNRILNAKVRPPTVGTEISPEKLSFRDKMKMFAMTAEEDANGSRPREVDFHTDY